MLDKGQEIIKIGFYFKIRLNQILLMLAWTALNRLCDLFRDSF